MPKAPTIGQTQRGVIAALLCLAFWIAVFDAQSSRQPASATPNASAQIGPNKQNDSRQKKSEWMASDDWLALFTLGLVIVGGIQLRLFWVQLRLIRESLDDAKESADAAKDAASAAERQAKVAEKTITELERPWVFVFGVKKLFPDENNVDFFVHYSVANYGKMPAIIEQAWVGFGFSDKGAPPIPPEVWDDHELMTSQILAPGDRRDEIKEYLPVNMAGDDLLVRLTDPEDLKRGRRTTFAPNFKVPPNNDVFFRAILQYRGPTTSGHRTAAMWLFSEGELQFIQRGGDDYNYAK